MASRNLSDLHPHLKPLAVEHKRRCALEGVDLLIYCTYRDNAEQTELYAQGRTKPGKIVTNAKAGQSAHNFTVDGKPAAKAYDCVPLIGGKPAWNASDPSWKIVGRIATELGLNWYGRPGAPFRENPHMELKRT